MKIKSILIIVIVVVLTVFAMQNTHAVIVNVFFWTPDLPLILLITLLLVAGFVAGYLAGGISQVKKKEKEY